MAGASPHRRHSAPSRRRGVAGRPPPRDRRQTVEPAAHSPQRTLFSVYARAGWPTETSTRTREGYERILRTHLNPTFGDMQLAAIAPADVRDWHSRCCPASPPCEPRPTPSCGPSCPPRSSTNSSRAIHARSAAPARPAGPQDPARHRRRARRAHRSHAGRLKLAVPLASWCALRYGELAELAAATWTSSTR